MKKLLLLPTHTGNLEGKMQDAKQTLLYADNYMAELGKAFERLTQTKITDSQVLDYIDCLFPDEEGLTGIQRKNIVRMKDDLKMRYFDAPDAKEIITIDTYGDNKNIIADGIPEIEAYMDEVLPDSEKEQLFRQELLEIVVDVSEYIPQKA